MLVSISSGDRTMHRLLLSALLPLMIAAAHAQNAPPSDAQAVTMAAQNAPLP